LRKNIGNESSRKRKKRCQERLCYKEREPYLNEIINNLENLLNCKENVDEIKKEEIFEL